MKKIFIIISFFLIVSCKDDNISKTEITQEDEKVILKSLPKYRTLKDMFIDASDFRIENNTLKFTSNNDKSPHVQVSKPIYKGDLEKVIKEIVKRDIVYVVFQTFAQTDINEITVTSIPIDGENYKVYFEKYMLTLKVDRKKAKDILKKHLQSEDFSILYKLENSIWLPSEEFSTLKFEKLNSVFDDLSN